MVDGLIEVLHNKEGSSESFNDNSKFSFYQNNKDLQKVSSSKTTIRDFKVVCL